MKNKFRLSRHIPEKIIFEEINRNFGGHNILVNKEGEFVWINPKGGKVIQASCEARFSKLEDSYGLIVENNSSFKLFGRS